MDGQAGRVNVGARKRKRGYHHGDLRRALVDAAVGLLARRGESGLTLREAARRAGVSQTAPYRHFRDKEALLAAVAEEGFRGLKEALVEAGGTERDPARRLRALCVAYVRFAADHPRHYRLMLSPAVRGSRHPALRAAALEAFFELVRAVAAPSPSAEVGSVDFAARTMATWSLAHGLALLAIDEQLPPEVRGEIPLDRLADAVTRVLLDGLVPDR